jgi:hypothetical protein
VTRLTDALAALDGQPVRIPAAAWPSGLNGLDEPGLYTWWVDEAGAADLSCGLRMALPEGRIYIGQAGADSSKAGVSSASTLRSRIGRDHLGGRVGSSTLRRALAAILLARLSLVLVDKKKLDAASEARLSAWMKEHLSLAVWGAGSGAGLAALEEAVVAALRPPLNVDHMPVSELRTRVLRLRAVVLAGIDDLWSAPDPALTDWRRILGEYGQAFDGYRYAAAVRRRECAEVADDVWRRREEEGCFTSCFADLRCALFWLQRWVHSAEQSPGWESDGELQGRVRRLYAAILAAWAAERGEEEPVAAARPESRRSGSSMVLLGIDCATQPAKTGLALGSVVGDGVCINECAVASKGRPAAAIAAEWLRGREEVLIALDAPLGWPQPLAASLQDHRAGEALGPSANALFSRATDAAMRSRLGKQPLEVGANLIARTAVAALQLLAELRELTGRPIPLAWEPCEPELWRAVEVYPAATRIAHAAPDAGGSLAGLEELLDCRRVEPALLGCADAVDACVCVLAAADFLAGRAQPPGDLELARREGWIWAPDRQRSQPIHSAALAQGVRVDQ